jgi:hypothetical protein
MVIMLLGHLMLQGTRASAGGETFPVSRVILAFLHVY